MRVKTIHECESYVIMDHIGLTGHSEKNNIFAISRDIAMISKTACNDIFKNDCTYIIRKSDRESFN